MKKEFIFIMTILLFFQSESGMSAASISHDSLEVVDYVSLLTGDSIKYWAMNAHGEVVTSSKRRIKDFGSMTRIDVFS